MSNTIPYIPASKPRKRELEKIMVAGNVPLKCWHDRAKDYFRAEGGSLRYSRTKFRSALLDVVAELLPPRQCVHIFGFRVPQTDMEKILCVKSIEWEMLTAFSRLIGQHAEKWSKYDNDSTISFFDLYGEGVLAFMQAVIYYTGEVWVKSKSKMVPVAFCTYAHHAIRRKMISICTRTSSFNFVTHQAADLYRQFEKAKGELNGPANFDEIIAQMQIDNKQQKILESMLVQVVHQSTLESYDDEGYGGDGGRNSDDYSSYSQTFDGLNGEWQAQGRHGRQGPVFTQHEFDLDLQYAINKLKLSPIERSVFDAFMGDEKRGWMARVARELKVTRMTITFAWRRVQKKLRKVYLRAA